MKLYPETHFKKEIDGLTVKGEFLPAMKGVQVSVYYKEDDKDENVCLVDKEILGRYNHTYPFSYPQPHEQGSLFLARGLLVFGTDPTPGRLELTLSLSAPAPTTLTFYIDESSPTVGIRSSPPAAAREA